MTGFGFRGIVLAGALCAASAFAPQLLKRAGAEVIPIHADGDGLHINDACGATALHSLQEAVRQQGAEYAKEGRVEAAWAAADHYVSAEVKGQERMREVTLFYTRGEWSSQCACDKTTLRCAGGND